MTVPVTVVSCVYGDSHDQFIEEWAAAVQALDPAPELVIVASDRPRKIPYAVVIDSVCTWRHSQAYYLNAAVGWAATEWVWIVDIDDLPMPDALEGVDEVTEDVWIVDIDDLPMPDALDGIDEVTEDVWTVGYRRSDGEVHLPPQLTPEEYLEEPGNPYAAGSMFRTSVFRAAGGFTDVAFQDWSLWRRMAMMGASVKASDRAHYRYRLHEESRSARELLPGFRGQHLVEMVLEDIRAVA